MTMATVARAFDAVFYAARIQDLRIQDPGLLLPKNSVQLFWWSFLWGVVGGWGRLGGCLG